MNADWQARITAHLDVLGGKPVVRGLRVSVEQVLRALAAGVPEAELLADFPDLVPDDLRACLAYAAEVVAGERVYPIPAAA